MVSQLGSPPRRSGSAWDRLRPLGAGEENIIIRVGTGPDGFSGPDPQAFLANRFQGRRDHVIATLEPRTADDLFIFGIDVVAHAHLDRAVKSEDENLGGWPEGLEESRDDDVGVENDPDHVPGCNRDSRRALRAAAISASISSEESWSRRTCLAVSQDLWSHSGAKSCSRTCRAYS